MPLEVELKFPCPDHSAIRTALKEAGAEPLGVVFEQNSVFDDKDRSLRASGRLLRLRQTDRCVLTAKRPPESAQGSAKALEEFETEVSDPQFMAQSLETLGYSEVLRYEKLREKWSFAGCKVCLDQVVFGFFVEIEGADEEGVRQCASNLGLDPDAGTGASYHELNAAHRARAGLEPDENFVFDPGQKAEFVARFGEPSEK